MENNDTRENRQQHANAIRDKYIPAIISDEALWDDAGKLSAQDLIILQKSVREAKEKGLFNKDQASFDDDEIAKKADAAVSRLVTMIVDKIKAASAIWTVTDGITRLPFIDDNDCVWLFSEKAYADECVDYFMQQYRTTFKVTEIKNPDVLPFLGTASHLQGAAAFTIDNGQAYIVIKAGDIVVAPDFSNVPAINRPVMNPAYCRALAKFQQERLWRASYPEKGEKLRRLENEMIKTFCEAKFLVPVKGMENVVKDDPNAEGAGVMQKGAKITIPMLTAAGEGENKKTATPAFTDWEEFNKIYSQKEWGGWIWTVRDLLAAPDDNVVINAGSLSFSLSKKMIGRMTDIYEQELTTGFISSAAADRKLRRAVLSGAKVPHSTSRPVIRRHDGKYCLAAFTFFYTKEDIQNGLCDRPTVITLADIMNGSVITEKETKEMEFSSAAYDVKYNVRSDAKYDTSKEYYDKAYAILDEVRRGYVEKGFIDDAKYHEYLDMIIANIPDDYRQFYRDLSI